MSERDLQDHQMLVKETGRFRISQEQEETINKLMEGLDLKLQDEVDDNEITSTLKTLAGRK